MILKPMPKLLKDMSKEELEQNYQVIMKWTYDRESSRTPEGAQEFEAGLRRVEDYEDELNSRGYNQDQKHKLYLNVIFDGELPSNEH